MDEPVFKEGDIVRFGNPPSGFWYRATHGRLSELGAIYVPDVDLTLLAYTDEKCTMPVKVADVR